MEWYFEMIRSHKIDATRILTQRFALSEYRKAFMMCARQGSSGAVKLLFEFPKA